MFAVRLTGTLISGPSASSCDDVPALMNMVLALSAANRSVACQSGATLTLNSPSSYADLAGIGTGKAVTKATLVVVKAKAPMQLRVTTDDGLGGDVVAVVPVSGLCILETDASKPVKLLEAQGSGVIEFAAYGPQ